MAYSDERTGLEVIPLSECIRLLEAKEVARAAFIVDGSVELFPVNYIWDGEGLVFRCDASSTLMDAVGTEFVIEIDETDERKRIGWSVIARGIATVVDPNDTPELELRLKRLTLYPWVGGEKERWIRLIPAPLTGRRVKYAPK